jgi:hypothetical protein
VVACANQDALTAMVNAYMKGIMASTRVTSCMGGKMNGGNNEY